MNNQIISYYFLDEKVLSNNQPSRSSILSGIFSTFSTLCLHTKVCGKGPSISPIE